MRAFCLLLLTAAAVGGADAAGAAEEAPTVIAAGFGQGLTGWQQRGEASFALDPAQHHDGAQSLRITVAPGVELKWQQAAYLFGPVALGDRFEVGFWVRSEGLTDGSGAYGALEFVDENDARLGIAHSTVDLSNGRTGWQYLQIEGKAPERTAKARVSLVLNSHGTAWFDQVAIKPLGKAAPWPDKGAAERLITVTDQVTQPRFGGVGFHVFDHVFPATKTELDEIIIKRWREVRPSFARMNDAVDWSPELKQQVARWMREFRRTDTELYLATWGPKDVPAGAERRAYAEQRAADLAWFVGQGCDNIRYYCLTNELSMGQWGALKGDLPKFKDYHQELYNAFARRGLKVGLLATDASPVGWWDTIEWATKNMDDITAIYGGHEYFNTYPPEDETFYEWFAGKLQWAVGLARGRGKEFVLGEFGSKQDGRTVNGVKLDNCVYFGTPSEKLLALQLGETVIGALNAGVYSLANWTFMDFPDSYSKTYTNKWGMFKRAGEEPNVDFATRPHYYGYGLLSRFFRGPATVYRVTTDDRWLRAGALAQDGQRASIVVVNRYHAEVPLRLTLGKLPAGRPWRRYVYDSANPPRSDFGDLQAPSGTVTARDGALVDRVGAGQLVVYTTDYDDTPPAAPTGLRAEGARLSWQASPAPDLCYYRVYAGDQQIGSTIATEFVDRRANPTGPYRVLAVDQSGNASR
ncbi:MAG: hypothetical protein HZB16_07800 [Armatimonadetes bacterium]|nr:hypothetical protein [Armatimonadota bacterium]